MRKGVFKCVPFLLCLTQPAPPQQDSWGTEWASIYSQAAKSYTPVVFRGDLNRVQGLGQHLRGAVGSHTARWYAR